MYLLLIKYLTEYIFFYISHKKAIYDVYIYLLYIRKYF